MTHYCPFCLRGFYDPRQTKCKSCGAPIPESLRFSPDEIAEFDRQNAKFQAEFERLSQLDKEWRDFYSKQRT